MRKIILEWRVRRYQRAIHRICNRLDSGMSELGYSRAERRRFWRSVVSKCDLRDFAGVSER